jgi:hypothetical protein
MLIKKYLCFNSPKVSNVFLITYKTAVTLKTPAIYLLIDCENSGLFCSKIYQQSNSLIFSIEKTHLNQNGLLVINLPSSDGIFYRLGALLCRLGMPVFFNQMWQKDSAPVCCQEGHLFCRECILENLVN